MIYRFHDYTLDEARRELRQREQLLAVEPKMFQVLLYLLQHRDRVVRKQELLEQCWPATFVSEAALTRCLSKLRKVVQPGRTAPPVIKTLHGHGYRFVAAVTHVLPVSAPEPVVSPEGSESPVSNSPARLEPCAPGREAYPDAEHRQLTVLCCALAGSTALAAPLDPEDCREVTVTYHTTWAGVIQRYGGHIAQYRGNGVLAYFGSPHAHEGAAQRAILAGLETLAALVDLNQQLTPRFEIPLAVRVGIHTGLVVVGDGGDGAPHGQLAFGGTPNLAAQIQEMAPPGSLVISAATYRLVQGYFVCQDLGPHAVPGVTEPVTLYQVLHASEARGRLDAASPRSCTPLVGREVEVAVLQDLWAQA